MKKFRYSEFWAVIFLLLSFQEAFAYQLADISFVLADEKLLEEIGVITPVDKKMVEEKTELKEKVEQQDEPSVDSATLSKK
jgi:hypothetical protein